MEIFPAQYSTLSSIALKGHIEKAYGLHSLTCRLLAHNVSDTYLLEGPQNKFVFRVYRKNYRSLDEIKGEMELLEILKAGSVPVSHPIAGPSGNTIQAFDAAEGRRYGVLFTYATGKPHMAPDNDQLTILGKNMALMHNITCDCSLHYERPVYDIDNTLRKPLALIRERFSPLADEYDYLQNIADKVIKKLSETDTTLFSYGYCHYDLLPKNFHFDEGNAVTFFDFDWAGKGWLANDLMTFRIQLFFLVNFKKITAEKADEMFGTLVEAYRSERPVSEEELAAIPLLGVMFFIYGFGFYEENFDDFAINFLTPRFIKERVELIKNWAEQI
jgi:Ser/Thr protein kinase RdoA (MazF antagonist)